MCDGRGRWTQTRVLLERFKLILAASLARMNMVGVLSRGCVGGKGRDRVDWWAVIGLSGYKRRALCSVVKFTT